MRARIALMCSPGGLLAIFAALTCCAAPRAATVRDIMMPTCIVPGMHMVPSTMVPGWHIFMIMTHLDTVLSHDLSAA